MTTANANAWDESPAPPVGFAERPEMIDDLQTVQPIALRSQHAMAPRRSEHAELAELARDIGPRDPKALLVEARRVGGLLGASAYYRFPAGNGVIEGPSIDLTDALAAVWGRIVCQVTIIDATDDRVVIRGRVVDLLNLTVVERDHVSAVMPAPAKFAAKPDQVERWRTMQIQSASSKAIRGAVLHALPAWLVDEAMAAAKEITARQVLGEAKSLPEAVAKSVAWFGQRGITVGHLEDLVGQPKGLWAVDELQALRVVASDLSAGRRTAQHVIEEATAARKPASTPAGGNRLAALNLDPQAAPATATAPTTAAAAPKRTRRADAPAAAPDPTVDDDPKRAEVLKEVLSVEEMVGDRVVTSAKQRLGVALSSLASQLSTTQLREYLRHLEAAADGQQLFSGGQP